MFGGKSSPEFTIDISPSNSVIETSLPSDAHTPLVASITNYNSRLTQKNILKIDTQLSVLKNYVDCKLSALTSKIHVFSDSIKNVLSNLQNKKHENSQIEVLTKNITFLMNETQKTLTTHLFGHFAKPIQSIENHGQQQLRQHQDRYQYHRQHE